MTTKKTEDWLQNCQPCETSENINDTQVMVSDDRVVIAVKSHREFTKSDRDNVVKAARNYANGRDVQVSTDKGLFRKLHKMNNR